MVHYERAVELAPSHEAGEAVVGLWHVKTELADWTNWTSILTKMRTSITDALSYGRPSPLSPYQSLFLPYPQQVQQSIASSWSSRHISEARQAAGWKRHYYKQQIDKEPIPGAVVVDEDGFGTTVSRQRQLKIGYISRRFEEYAGTQLMLRIFGLHNRERVHVTCYAHGPDDGSMERSVVRRDCDRFDDVSLLSPHQVATKIASDRIDILIDYDGAHNFNNMAVLALRPAPIQVTYLGFAGTSGGTDAVDYIITDRFITPPDSQEFYSEKFMYLPETYQPQVLLHIQYYLSIVALEI
jgi:protein O-GlcNAc transferase